MDIAYHLSDVLQMELIYANNNYSGSVSVAIEDTPIEFKMTVLSWFKQPKSMGLLCSIKQHLMALCTVRIKDGQPSFYVFLLNKGSLPSGIALKSTDTYEEAVNKVRDGIVMTYVKASNETTWKEGLNNVKTLDGFDSASCEENYGGGHKAVSRA